MLGRLIKLLRIRAKRGFFNIFIKITAHRGDYLSEPEKAGRC